MTSRQHVGGGPEVLEQGRRAPHRSTALVWGVAAAGLAVGVVLGVQVDDVLDDRRTARRLESAPPRLSAGVIQEATDPGGGRRFAVPLYNAGTHRLTVESVVAGGWVVPGRRERTVTVPPGGWVMFPLLVRIDCAAIGPTAPERVTVRSSTAGGTFEQDVAMPATSRVLDDEGSRLCVAPQGSVPTAAELVGDWLVEEAGRSRGTLVRLREDGTFAVDPDLYRFGTSLDALGTYTRSGAQLRLVATGGDDCRAGDRTRWVLTLLEDGRLHIRHRPGHGRWCGIDGGEVWVARRAP